MSVETDGIRAFLKKITQSGLGGFGIIPAVAGKRIVLRSAFVVCDTDSLDTYGKLNLETAPIVAEVVALKGSYVLYDPSSPPLPAALVNKALRIDVESVEPATTGFAALGCWIYGTYELEG